MAWTTKPLEKGANRRIFNIDTHVGMAAAGVIADARQLAEIASDEASSYRSDYGSPIPLLFLNQRNGTHKNLFRTVANSIAGIMETLF